MEFALNPIVCIVSSPVVRWVVHLSAGPGAHGRHPSVLCDLRLSSRAGINTFLWTGLQSWYQHLSLAGSCCPFSTFETNRNHSRGDIGRCPPQPSPWGPILVAALHCPHPGGPFRLRPSTALPLGADFGITRPAFCMMLFCMPNSWLPRFLISFVWSTLQAPLLPLPRAWVCGTVFGLQCAVTARDLSSVSPFDRNQEPATE